MQFYSLIFQFKVNGQFPGKYNLQKQIQNIAKNLNQLRTIRTFNKFSETCPPKPTRLHSRVLLDGQGVDGPNILQRIQEGRTHPCCI